MKLNLQKDHWLHFLIALLIVLSYPLSLSHSFYGSDNIVNWLIVGLTISVLLLLNLPQTWPLYLLPLDLGICLFTLLKVSKTLALLLSGIILLAWGIRSLDPTTKLSQVLNVVTWFFLSFSLTILQTRLTSLTILVPLLLPFFIFILYCLLRHLKLSLVLATVLIMINSVIGYRYLSVMALLLTALTILALVFVSKLPKLASILPYTESFLIILLLINGFLSQ
ncbi:hypothetical protein FC83_GL002646 [Agrilactobacillus composti DSM 18527 = JCM 14202]|uniref:Uncharacterized protein n=1 Tax=Agrilactobacillus composti DSM 18527 = JCM 14202 TaxID=1423734 RepID=X0PWD5_9LACO|nr:hypothetical protein [Agrilactobacillus composti]KRM36768.1 hypothetical protein FC83_GL002646 [Agrilactobacillus composti DSM 18527 = JCM 14202]GAF41881.1 hypothetical protein JCM14202_3846 [Agrilactobacillus composti DSM 18527 = JCM 14202]